jgi:hypothetical protein
VPNSTVEASTSAAPASSNNASCGLTGRVFRDPNGNGTFESGEQPVPGAVVQVSTQQGRAELVAAPDGSFEYRCDVPGSATVRVLGTATPTKGGKVRIVNLAAAQTIDFGYSEAEVKGIQVQGDQLALTGASSLRTLSGSAFGLLLIGFILLGRRRA